MSDLVDRLRARANRIRGLGFEGDAGALDCDQAADDLSCLRAENERLTGLWERDIAALDRALARITELERALNIVTGGAEAAEVRIAELEGEVERLTMERDDALFMRATLAAPCQIDGCQYSTVKGETL